VSTDEVLDSIDRAVHDWETSEDAMRWKPDVTEDTAPAVMRPQFLNGPGVAYIRDETHLFARDEVHEWTEIGTVPPGAQIFVEAEPVPYAWGGMVARCRPVAWSVPTAYDERERQAAVQWGPVFRFAAHVLATSLDPKDHVRCRECNPCANPPPSPDGKKYARRRKNRRRR
jgi:hypothetical protein